MSKGEDVIIAVEIIVGSRSDPRVEEAAEVLADACRQRGFPVHRLAEPTSIDNRLCLYLSTSDAGHPVADLLDVGVRRNAFARLDQTQYLVRSWRARARLHIAMAARTPAALLGAARFVAERIAAMQDFTRLDVQGPVYAEGE